MATLKIKVPPLEDPIDSHPVMCQRLEELITTKKAASLFWKVKENEELHHRARKQI